MKKNEIKFDERNYRKHSDRNKALIKKSLEELGAGRSVVIDADDTLVAGNGVYEQAQKLKMPVRVVETDGSELVVVKRTDIHTQDEKRRKLALADNAASDLSEWDVPLIETDWAKDVLADWGVELPEIEEAPTEEAQEDNFDPDEEKIETVCKEGDLWQLGNHRLMCGDSTKPEDVARLMDGEKAQMTFSDAPYNVDFKGSMSRTTKNGVLIKHKCANTRHDAIHNDKMDKQQFHDFMMLVLSNIKEHVTGAWYLSFSAGNLEELLNPLRESGMDWKSIIIWIKNQAAFSMKDYKSRYEPIAYGRFNEDYFGKRGFEEDIWEYQRTLKNDLHPTMKPVPLISKMVTVSSKEGNIVLDLFGGSGSTLIACEQLGRKCYMMELDPHYCDVIVARWEKLTGQTAIKIK